MSQNSPSAPGWTATYFSASGEDFSVFSPMASEEKLPWMSSDTALLAESGSSRPGLEVEMLQGESGKGRQCSAEVQSEGAQSRGRPGKQHSLGAAPSVLWLLEEKGAGASPWSDKERTYPPGAQGLMGGQHPWLLFKARAALTLCQ